MSPQTGTAGLVLPPESSSAHHDLHAAIVEHLDDWAALDPRGHGEQQLDGYRAALDNAITKNDLVDLAAELGVIP